MSILKMSDVINNENPMSFNDYIVLERKLTRMRDQYSSKGYKEMKIALLSSFTLQGLDIVFKVKCWQAGIAPQIYTAGYNQYRQEIIDRNSGLRNFDPDVIVLFIDTRSLLGEDLFAYDVFPLERRRLLMEEKYAEMVRMLETLENETKAKILVHNYEVPSRSPLGAFAIKQEFDLSEAVSWLNLSLKKLFLNSSRVHLVDYEKFCSRYGKDNIFDPRMYYLADMKLKADYYDRLCDEYLAYLRPICALNKKCLVLDLDNTIWGGVIGEDGIAGIKLGPDQEGKPFLEFQQYLLSLHDRGIILAINSRNNPADIKEVIDKHPYMLLKADKFAAMIINWEDKASNLKEIAKRINIGLDSLVYIDDDKGNRELVRNTLPEVTVIDLPADPALYLVALQQRNEFSVLQVTEEDRKKGKMYAAQRKRQEFEETAVNMNDFLNGLDLTLRIDRAGDYNIPRIAQLTQKTNQFNLTVRRYQEEDIIRFTKDKDRIVTGISIHDKFGDYGLGGVIIIDKLPDSWQIDTFLLSCRVLGKGVEEAMLAYVIDLAKKSGIDKLFGTYITEKKNEQVREFYERHGFRLEQETEAQRDFVLQVKSSKPAYPDHIKIIGADHERD